MAIKEKLIGLVLIIVGAWPFLLKINLIGNFFSQYKFLEVMTPGEIIYQTIVIILGIMLLWKLKTRAEIK